MKKKLKDPLLSLSVNAVFLLSRLQNSKQQGVRPSLNSTLFHICIMSGRLEDAIEMLEKFNIDAQEYLFAEETVS